MIKQLMLIVMIVFHFGRISGLQSNQENHDMLKNNQNYMSHTTSKINAIERKGSNPYETQSNFEVKRQKRQYPLLVFANGRLRESKISPIAHSWELPRNRKHEYVNGYHRGLVKELRNLSYMKEDIRKRKAGLGHFEKILGRI